MGVPLLAAASVIAFGVSSMPGPSFTTAGVPGGARSAPPCQLPAVVGQPAVADVDGALTERAACGPQPAAPTRSVVKRTDASDSLITHIPDWGRSGSG